MKQIMSTEIRLVGFALSRMLAMILICFQMNTNYPIETSYALNPFMKNLPWIPRAEARGGKGYLSLAI